MTDNNLLIQKFNSCCFSLSPNDIFDLEKSNKGTINNVIAMIEKHCFGVKLYDNESDLIVEMFYINNDKSLKGDIIRIDIRDQDYFQILLRFCVSLSKEYVEVDALDTFNTFQKHLRALLEKRDFFTITNLDLKRFEGKEGVLSSTAERGIIKLDFIDKRQFYRDFFNNIYKHEVNNGKEFVYLMLNSDTSLIKIGTSRNPKYRERTLHSQEPKVSLVALWCCKKEVEKKLHNKFSHKRIRGEWFRLTINELKEIEDIMETHCGDNSL